MIRLNFVTVWAGQAFSIFGSNLSSFALGVWLYQRTGSASNFALVALCAVLPQILLSPLAGVLVDRYNRRWMMALADGGSAVCTLCLSALFFSGRIQIWHIFIILAASAAFGSLQAPAYGALVASTVAKAQLGRANGLLQFGRAMADILAPAAAGWLLAAVQMPGILLIDLGTFGLAGLTLALVRFPNQEYATQELSPQGLARRSWWNELRDGLEALRAEPGLLNLLRYQALFAFLWSLFGVLVTPMVLGFSTPEGLGTAITIAGFGLLAGSGLMAAWGGPKRRLSGLLFFELLSALSFCLMGLRPVLALVAGAAFCAHFTLAFVSSLAEAIWQSQVRQELQGRIFAGKQTVVKAATLCAYLLAGGLADRVLEPALHAGGPLAGSLGHWFGVGPGRGIAALFVLVGLVKAASVVVVYLSPEARRLDQVSAGGTELAATHPL